MDGLRGRVLAVKSHHSVATLAQRKSRFAPPSCGWRRAGFRWTLGSLVEAEREAARLGGACYRGAYGSGGLENVA